jgi:hypothetical protein
MYSRLSSAIPHVVVGFAVMVVLGAGVAKAQSEAGSIVARGRNNVSRCQEPPPNRDFKPVVGGWHQRLNLPEVCLILSLDESRTGDANEGGGGRFLTSSSMAVATDLLLDAGFSIATTSLFESEYISDACVLYTGLVDVDFTPQELADVEQFVYGGGGLVIQRDWDLLYPAADPLAAVFWCRV